MGLISDVAKGKVNFVHADIENLSDPRNWLYPPKSKVALNPANQGDREQKQIVNDVQNPDSVDEEE